MNHCDSIKNGTTGDQGGYQGKPPKPGKLLSAKSGPWEGWLCMKGPNTWPGTVHYLFLPCPLPQARERPAAMPVSPGCFGRERMPSECSFPWGKAEMEIVLGRRSYFRRAGRVCLVYGCCPSTMFARSRCSTNAC